MKILRNHNAGTGSIIEHERHAQLQHGREAKAQRKRPHRAKGSDIARDSIEAAL